MESHRLGLIKDLEKVQMRATKWPRVFCGLADLRTCGATNGYFADLAADVGPQNTHRRSASPQNTHTSTVSVFADR